MSRQFDKEFWEAHWSDGHDASVVPPHPALDTEIAALDTGTALDAGSGEGAEAGWLAAHGWEVTAVDISAEALRRAAGTVAPRSGHISWVEADLTSWQPATSFDLVTTFYVHPTIPQLAFYERIATWVAPGGTLLIVGHGQAHGHAHSADAVTDPERIRSVLDPARWDVQTAEVRDCEVGERHWHPVTLRDVIVRARRR
ncbi:class I SAM-dependent methyltransferase [Humibacter soli]